MVQTPLPAVAFSNTQLRKLPQPPAWILAPSKVLHFNEEGGCFHLLRRGKTIIRKTQTSLPNDSCNIFTAPLLGSQNRAHPGRGRYQLTT